MCIGFAKVGGVLEGWDRVRQSSANGPQGTSEIQYFFFERTCTKEYRADFEPLDWSSGSSCKPGFDVRSALRATY